MTPVLVYLTARAKRCEQLLVAALLVGWAGILLGLGRACGGRLQRLDDEEEDRRGGRQERDHVGDERAVAEDGVVDRECQAAEVGLADDHRHDRHHEVRHERVDDRTERNAHHERDGELDDVALHQKVLELLDHWFLPRLDR